MVGRAALDGGLGGDILLDPVNDVFVVRCGRTAEPEAPRLWERIDAIVELLAD